jgi:multicomponent Na+:H+ antiporter subunit E
VQGSNSTARAALARGAGFLGLWIVLAGLDPADLVVGVVSAAAATWTSLTLLPADTSRIRVWSLLALLPRFLRKSWTGGWDVARRALDPRMPLRPDFVNYPTGFPRGSARKAFACVSSLMPGSVPVEDSDAGILYHCLDSTQPVVEQLAAEERAYATALAPERGDA